MFFFGDTVHNTFNIDKIKVKYIKPSLYIITHKIKFNFIYQWINCCFFLLRKTNNYELNYWSKSLISVHNT